MSNLKKMALIPLLFLVYYLETHTSHYFIIPALEKLQHYNTTEIIIIFSIIYLLSSLLFIPIGLPLNMFAGMMWGTWIGALLVNILATFGAGIAFLVARKSGLDFSKKLLRRYPVLTHFEHAIQSHDWQFIALARLNPIVPFSASNYIFGLLPGLVFNRYILVTALANFFPCVVFAYIGATFHLMLLKNSTSLHTWILQAGIVLLLISTLYSIKILATPNLALPKE